MNNFFFRICRRPRSVRLPMPSFALVNISVKINRKRLLHSTACLWQDTFMQIRFFETLLNEVSVLQQKTVDFSSSIYDWISFTLASYLTLTFVRFIKLWIHGEIKSKQFRCSKNPVVSVLHLAEHKITLPIIRCFHHCDPGSIIGLASFVCWVCCWCSASRGFFPRVLLLTPV